MVNDPYLDAYRESVQKHGSGFEATLWANEDTQKRRFEVFTQMCFLVGKRVLDAGCSRGDFAAFLINRQISFERYIGVDALDEVITAATGRRLPGCEFHCGDFIAQPKLLSIGNPQVICISGSLNTMTLTQALQALESAWSAAGESLIFNFLSDRAGHDAAPQTQPARRLDTFKLLDWAMRQTPVVAFRQDYFEHGHDATILMRKPR